MLPPGAPELFDDHLQPIPKQRPHDLADLPGCLLSSLVLGGQARNLNFVLQASLPDVAGRDRRAQLVLLAQLYCRPPEEAQGWVGHSLLGGASCPSINGAAWKMCCTILSSTWHHSRKSWRVSWVLDLRSFQYRLTEPQYE